MPSQYMQKGFLPYPHIGTSFKAQIMLCSVEYIHRSSSQTLISSQILLWQPGGKSDHEVGVCRNSLVGVT